MKYRGENGIVMPKSNTSLHHVFWEARNYRPGEEQRFRNMSGLVLRMTNETHNNLHAETFPPLKPSKGLREQIAEFSCGTYESDEYAQFYRIAHFIGDVANSSWSSERADEAFHIHENLMEQAPFIEQGRVTELRAVA